MSDSPPKAPVIGHIPPVAFPAEMLMRVMPGWADQTEGAILFTFDKGSPLSMRANISDEVGLMQLMLAREYLSVVIQTMLKNNAKKEEAP